MKVFVLGAGASKAYGASPTGLRMPVARDFFETYLKLPSSENPWVLVGGLLNWLEKEKRVGSAADYLLSGVDIEVLHSEIEADRSRLLNAGADFIELYHSSRAFNELVFLFASVINDIQNGPVSIPHIRLAEALGPEDAVVTFNWDTLLDRALASLGNWSPDWGYGVRPQSVFRNGWREPAVPTGPVSRLVKLHGSTNWLTAYVVLDSQTREITLTHALDPSAFNVFVEADVPFPCYAGRYMSGYAPFSYGYYPPNLDFPGVPAPEGFLFVRMRLKTPLVEEGGAGSQGLVSMPLIIPPVRNKSYELFGNLFGRLWSDAEALLAAADEITVIGYSFPKTDVQSDRLFRRAFSRRSTMPKVTVIDPAPDRPAAVFRDGLGIREPDLVVRRERFDEHTVLVR